MTRTLIDCVVLQCNQDALETIDSALADHSGTVMQNETQPEQEEARERAEKARDRSLAMLLRLRVRAQTELLEFAETGEVAQKSSAESVRFVAEPARVPFNLARH